MALSPPLGSWALEDDRRPDPAAVSGRPGDPAQPPSPPWTRDLIIYEIAPRGFTSPSGPESGSFRSLQARLPYLEQLGINGIWLAGYSLCDPHHFYNIWTQYAVIEPDRFDPALGTGEEFRSLIDEAHRRGIRVFLDVITHGLMSSSPIIERHPGWFRGASWGMTDYDWNGGHPELDEWWVKIWSDFVTRYGVDGFRLDVSIFRPDLWERIRQNAAAAGHPIVIWEEANSALPGVTDFSQHEYFIKGSHDHQPNEIVAGDMPGYFDRKFGRAGEYTVEVRYADGEIARGATGGGGAIAVHLEGLRRGRVGRRNGEEDPRPDGLPNVVISLDHIAPKPVDDIIVRSDTDEIWALKARGWQQRPLYVDLPDTWSSQLIGPRVEIYIATLSWGPAIQLSCHDHGWEGFPLDRNPYMAQGSRSLFGYSFLFSPMIPVFFAGEEFDATFHPLPGLSPKVYGGSDPGRGRWLYGAMLDWDEPGRPGHREMLEDVRRMIAIRRQNPDLLHMVPGGAELNLRAVPASSQIPVPVPYLRWNDRAAILVAANRSREQDALIRARVTLDDTGIPGSGSWIVSDLWAGGAPRTLTDRELESFDLRVRRDGAGSGGLAVFRIEPAGGRS